MTVVHSNPNVVYYKGYMYNSVQNLHRVGKMHGVKRVALFCTMTAILPTILIITPLYLRHSIFADVKYYVAESDVVSIKDGISSIFCDSHTLRMNTTFNAFQLDKEPRIGNKKKHIRLKKSMSLPDDTLEYWGFYLLKGATVYLKVCSRYDGSSILVVRGTRTLRTCGLLEHNQKKFGAEMDVDYQKVVVTFETKAQEIVDEPLQVVKNKTFDRNTGAEDHSEIEDEDLIGNYRDLNSKHNERHARKKSLRRQEAIHRLRRSLKDDGDVNVPIGRMKRDTGQILDRGIEHGGTARNYDSNGTDESSTSSFENGLLTCYNGAILLKQEFQPSHLCENVRHLEKLGDHMKATHNVSSDGYYYYIFYSDNDYVYNDVHAIFDIYKPTYQYNNISQNVKCMNTTECTFSIPFWSDQSVIVEVPTRDGIEHEEDDITVLISTCHPRMSVYMIFPISVMFLILGCAFL